MYTRLIQGYQSMDAEQQAVSASAARQLRLMVSCLKNSSHNMFIKILDSTRFSLCLFVVKLILYKIQAL